MKIKVTLRDEPPEAVEISTPFIKLDAFLKFSGACETGGAAKTAVLEELVKVNGEICTQRGKKLRDGDRVDIFGRAYTLKAPVEDI